MKKIVLLKQKILIFLFLVILILTSIQIRQGKTNEIHTYAEASVLPLNIENVINELKIKEIKHLEIVIRQIFCETGYLQSERATKDNNLFGFKKDKYMKFGTWQESVAYYKRWQDKKYKGGNYYDFLEKIGYASDSSYIEKLKQIKPSKKVARLIKRKYVKATTRI